LIDTAFQLIRRNATPMFTLGALVSIPIVVLQATVMHTSPLAALTSAGQTPAQGMGPFLLYFALIFSWSGKPVVVADTIKRALSKFVPMFIAYILMSIAVGLGVIGLFVGAIIVALLLFAVPALIAFENVGIFAAFERSIGLSSGLKGHIFVTCLLAFVLYFVGYIIVVVVAATAGKMLNAPLVGTVLVAVGTTVLVPVFPIVFTLLYYDARIRKEGFDIQLMAEQVPGSRPAAQPAV
jgi:hypothetical protein